MPASQSSGRIVHVLVSGRVQGVGYRALIEREAKRLSLSGWIRNRSDGGVEAVFTGEDDAIQRMMTICADGPRFAKVENVSVADGAPSLLASDGRGGFAILPSL